MPLPMSNFIHCLVDRFLLALDQSTTLVISRMGSTKVRKLARFCFCMGLGARSVICTTLDAVWSVQAILLCLTNTLTVLAVRWVSTWLK